MQIGQRLPRYLAMTLRCMASSVEPPANSRGRVDLERKDRLRPQRRVRHTAQFPRHPRRSRWGCGPDTLVSIWCRPTLRKQTGQAARRVSVGRRVVFGRAWPHGNGHGRCDAGAPRATCRMRK